MDIKLASLFFELRSFILSLRFVPALKKILNYNIYNKFNSNERKDWLNKFGGIKIFRDEFRVRPYGEVKDSAFDWLRLGARKATSPAPTSHPSGSWKVEPDNVAGAINITRISNLNFQDKSSREGLQENEVFKVFQNIILKIIAKFEEDRAKIARQMWLFYENVNMDAKNRKQADELAKKILEEDFKNLSQTNNTHSTDSEKVILAKSLRDKEEEIEKLEDEQKMLRGMASSGIVVASFAHELGSLKDILNGRVDNLRKILLKDLPSSKFDDSEDFLNPYILLEDMKKQDNKLQNWLNFSLSAARKDKRKRKKVNINGYLNAFKNSWNSILSNRQISFNIETSNNIDEIDMRVFEIDLDSIFNNLIVNTEELNQKIDEFIHAIKSMNISYFDNVKNDLNLYDELIFNFNDESNNALGYISKQDMYLYFNLIYGQNYFSNNKDLLKLLKKDDFFKQDVNSNKTSNGKKRYFIA